jgi:hypothetical protein
LEVGTLDVKEEGGQSSSFSLGTSHGSMLELAEEEEENYLYCNWRVPIGLLRNYKVLSANDLIVFVCVLYLSKRGANA